MKLIDRKSLGLLVRTIVVASLLYGVVNQGNAMTTPSTIVPEVITFESQGVVLSGTLTMPPDPRAGVVIVSGSGRAKQSLSLANYLAANDIAVLTYDKRGVGKSGGVYAGPEVGTNNVERANLLLLASDASSALKILKAQPGVRNIPVGFLGSSQAGWIVPLSSRMNNSARFMVLFSGPLVTAREQLRFQFYTNGEPTFWNTHSEAEARKHILTDPDRFSFTDTDPRDALGELSIPGLWMFGSKDVLTPVVLSLERLSALKETGKPYEYQLYPDGDHNMLSMGKTGQDVLDVAIRWIHTVAGRAR
jgi:uncharacterized protein